MIDLADRGLTLGDGLFETLLAVDGELEDAAEHLARLTAGCAVLGLPPPRADAVNAMQQALDAAGLTGGRAAVRLTYTAGPGGRGLNRPASPAPAMFASAAPAPVWTTPARLVTARTRRNEGSAAARLKSLSYLDNVLARREALAMGADEAVMLNNAGEVAGGAAGNLFWLEGETLCTPALECGVLAGIMRGRVIAGAKAAGLGVREDRFEAAALERATGAFLTNALIGARPVAEIDGRSLNQQVAQRVTESVLRGRR